MANFPSVKAKDLLKILERDPLNYRVVRQTGSHRRMKSPGRPTITFAFHHGRSLAPSEVRAVLVRDVGLAEDEALGLL